MELRQPSVVEVCWLILEEPVTFTDALLAGRCAVGQGALAALLAVLDRFEDGVGELLLFMGGATASHVRIVEHIGRPV